MDTGKDRTTKQILGVLRIWPMINMTFEICAEKLDDLLVLGQLTNLSGGNKN